MLFSMKLSIGGLLIYILYLKSYRMSRRGLWRGPMMTDTGTGRILTTEVISPIQSYNRGTRTLHEDVEHLSRRSILSAGQSVREKGGGEQKSAQPTTTAVIEQWICFVLGLVCMAFGMWGICM